MERRPDYSRCAPIAAVVDCGAIEKFISSERSILVVRGLCFASGVIFGVLLACAACSQVRAINSGPNPPPPPPTGYYGSAGPAPGSHPEISKAMGDLQHARYVLQVKAASDYRGHKANAIGYIDNAIGELQTCMSMP
jgi:hypothetical protein